MSGAASPEQRFAAAFARLEPRRAEEPAWLHAARKAAIARFGELGFPARRLEEWKYTNVAPIAALDLRVAEETAETDPERRLPALPPFLTDATPRLVFVNGTFAPGLSATENLAGGVEAGSLASALAGGASALAPHLTRIAPLEGRAFAALNTAFFADGAWVRVARGAAPRAPITAVFLTTAREAAFAAHPRLLVVVENGARARFVEAHVGAGDGDRLTNAVTELRLGENAELEHVKLTGEAPRAFHLATIAAHQERDSRLTSTTFSLGGALVRNEIVVALAGEGAESHLDGLFVASEGEQADSYTTLDHRMPHGTSRELYRGILAGRSRAVFNGQIVVRPHAQKTDAQQRNDNLLLSEGADVDTKPQLEIYADDVKCTHGSTIGHLDDESLFYLRSRGVGASEARALLTRGFASEITGRLPETSLREGIEALVLERLAAPLAGGETR